MMHRPVPNKLIQQFPENNSSRIRLIRFSQTYCSYDEITFT